MPKPSCQLQTRYNQILHPRACVQYSLYILSCIISAKKGIFRYSYFPAISDASDKLECSVRHLDLGYLTHQTLVITTAMRMMRPTAKLVGEQLRVRQP